MMCTCKQCGEEFELTDSEIKFYNNKHLDLPKRCEGCRKKNKQQNRRNQGTKQQSRQVKNSRDVKYDNKLGKKYILAASIIVVIILITLFSDRIDITKIIHNTEVFSIPESTQSIDTDNISENKQDNNVDRNSDSSQVSNGYKSDNILKTVVFRNEDLLNEHYLKHGKEMGFSSASEYEAAAGNVVNNKESLHKTELEDGDDVYYLQSSNDFVIVSTDGYIRTYFKPNDGIEYYNRQ